MFREAQEVSFQSALGVGEASSIESGGSVAKKTAALPSNMLILIGTVHGDPRGYDRALKVLQHFRPEVVTVEISWFSWRYRLRHGPRWQRLLAQALEGLPPGAAQHLAIRRLAAQVSLPFEVRAVRDYCREYGVPWQPLDLGGPSRRHLPRYARELLSAENLRALLDTADEPLEDYVSREYQRARLACRRLRWRPLGASAETRRRERLWARRLRQCLASYDRVAHLGGWEHLAPWRDEIGLWQELADLKPLRLFLDEAEEK